MKIVTITDAWHPQVNGVVRTIDATNRELEKAGHTVGGHRSRPVRRGSAARAIPRSGCRSFPTAASRTCSTAARLRQRRRFTSPPRGRSATPRAAIALRAACPSRPPTTRDSRSTCRRCSAFPSAGPTPSCAASTATASSVMAPTPHRRGRAARQRARQRRALDARRRPRRVPVRATNACWPTCRARSSCTSAACRWRRTSRPSSASTCPGTKVVAGVGPALDVLKQRFPEVHFVGVLEFDGARAASTVPPTCSSSRA